MVKTLRSFISENVFTLFYSWWIVFLDVEFLLEIISLQHFNGIFYYFTIVLTVEKSAAVLIFILQM